jgi:small subunit ribosomal protein S6
VAKYPPDPRKYELMIVVAPTVGDEGLPAVVERISAYVTEKGGEIESVNHENPWGRRRLAYEIQNFQDAFYVLYYFTIEPRFIDEIERDLRLEEIVIRHLLVRYDPLTEKVVKAPKPGREERQDGDSERPARAERAPVATAEAAVATAEPEEATAEPEEATPEPEVEAPADADGAGDEDTDAKAE